MNLASLPSDIIRNILRFEDESLDGMRLISPRWRTIGLEYRPVIASANIDVESGKADLLSINVSEKYVDYFGFGNWTNNIFEAPNSEKMINLYTALKSVNSCAATKLFNRCSRIEKVELKFIRTSSIKYHDLAKAINFFGDSGIGALVMYEPPNLNLHFRSAVLQLIKSRSFERLDFHRREATFVHDLVNNLSTYQTFFSEAVRFVSQIQLKTVDEFNANSLLKEWRTLEQMLNNVKGLKAEFAILDDMRFGKVMCISITSRK